MIAKDEHSLNPNSDDAPRGGSGISSMFKGMRNKPQAGGAAPGHHARQEAAAQGVVQCSVAGSRTRWDMKCDTGYFKGRHQVYG